MDNFNIIYKILKQLEKDMDYDEFDMDFVSAEYLKISENRRVRIWEMLTKEGYVDGVNIKYGAQGDIVISISTPVNTKIKDFEMMRILGNQKFSGDAIRMFRKMKNKKGLSFDVIMAMCNHGVIQGKRVERAKRRNNLQEVM